MVLKILTQTPGYILCVKPRGVSSEAGEGGMPELIAQVLGISPERVLPVHRLDRETTGLVLFVKEPLLSPWYDAMLEAKKID